MAQSQGPLSSFGEVARRCLNDADWPADSPIQERSLAAIFSKLDRGVDLDWLADRPAVQRILARILSAALDDVRALLDQRQVAAHEARRLRLDDLRFARSFDLQEEPLPPGIPSELLKPGIWRHSYWQAGSGAGRTLTGQWLEARGLASFVRGRTWDDVEARLPGGPVLIELTNPDPDLALPVRSDVCIASAQKPPEGFDLIQTPALEPLARELIEWAIARLPADKPLDVESMLEWLAERPLGDATFESLGTLLGLCGLADEHGVRSVAGRPRHKLLERFFRARIAEALDAGAPHAAWLKKAGYEALLGVMRVALTDSDSAWDVPRNFEAWLELVPREHQREADVDWMRIWLNESAQGIRPSDAERAARKMPPGAYRLIRALEHTRLLREQCAGEFILGPRWFAVALREEALASLLSGTPVEWGEALLRPASTQRVFDTLLEKLRAGNVALIDDVVDFEVEHSLSQAAALEATFRAAGLALLSGAELTTESLRALWEEQARLVFELQGQLPAPRIEYEETDPAFSRGAFYLAALAISEELGVDAGKAMPLLAPWKTSAASSELAKIFDIIWQSIEQAEAGSTWLRGAFSLAYRLRATIGPVRDLELPHPLEQPGVILDEVAHGVLNWTALAELAARPRCRDMLQQLAEERRVAHAELARAIWHAWDDAGRPQASPDLFDATTDFGAQLWKHVPSDLLLSLLGDASSLPYAAFGVEQWRTLESRLQGAPDFALPNEALRHAPESIARWILSARLVTEPVATVLWQRFPGLVMGAIEHALGEARGIHESQLRLLLIAAPSAQCAELSQLFARHPALWQLPEPVVSMLREVFHTWIRTRSPAYRTAYACLSLIDEKLYPIRQLSLSK